MLAMSHTALENGMENLSLAEDVSPQASDDQKPQDQSESLSTSDDIGNRLNPLLVDPRPWPPVEDLRRPRGTGVWYYGFYIGDGVVENYVCSKDPSLAKYGSGMKLAYGLKYFQRLLNDPRVTYQMASVRPWHRTYVPSLPPDETEGPVLCLFPLTEKGFERRLTKKNAQKLAKILGGQPTSWEILYFN